MCFRDSTNCLHCYAKILIYDSVAFVMSIIYQWIKCGFYADLDVLPARSIKTCPALQPFFRLQMTKYETCTPMSPS